VRAARSRERSELCEQRGVDFRCHMMLHEMIIDGREASDATQLWVLALMRYPQFVIHNTVEGFYPPPPATTSTG
jgi:hypothetical protein